VVDAAVIDGMRRLRLMVRFGVVVVACTSFPTGASAMNAMAVTEPQPTRDAHQKS
jgi:hypothetical protein